MEYSLQELNQKAALGSLRLDHFTDKLNLIGNEVDDLIFEQNQENSLTNDIRIVLKVPANREDLMNEVSLLNDLSTFFSFSLKKKWKIVKADYSCHFQRIYGQSKDHEVFTIISGFPEIRTYTFKTNIADQSTSPRWIQKKLKLFGEESQTLFSDIINLVFLEWGQKVNFLQIHDSVDMTSLRLKRLEKETPFNLSNGNSIKLPIGTFVIIDQHEIIHDCFGYSEKSLLNNEKYVTFQIWSYDIHSNEYEVNPLESPFSFRVFRQSFYENFRYAIQRLFTLVQITSEQQKLKLQIFKSERRLRTIQNNRTLSLKQNSSKNLLNLSKYNISIFKQAGLELICQTKDKLYFQVPNVRKDLKREIDIVEEYSRFTGYQNFEEITPTKKSIQNIYPAQKIRNYFLINGFHEIQTSPLQQQSFRNKQRINILNPISNELGSLRTELISSCIALFESNSYIQPEQTRFFEIGRTFQKNGRKLEEIEKVGGIFQIRSNQTKQQKDFEWFSAKALIENFLDTFGYPIDLLSFSFENFSIFSFSHPKKSLRIKSQGKTIGLFGQINPQKNKKVNSKFNTYFFEFDLNYFSEWRSKSQVKVYQDYSKYPYTVRDLSFIFPKTILFSQIKKQLRETFPILKRVNIFDLYFDEENSKYIRLGVRLEFQSLQRTLFAKEIEDYINQISDLLINNFEGKKLI